MRRLAVKKAAALCERRAAHQVIPSVIRTKSRNIPSAGVMVFSLVLVLLLIIAIEDETIETSTRFSRRESFSRTSSAWRSNRFAART